MSVYYLGNIFQDNEDDLDFLLDLVFSFPEVGEFLFFEYGYNYPEPFVEGIETFKDNTNRLWFRPKSKMEARAIHESFVINCVVLTKDKEMDSCKFKLSIVEAPESIELMATEIRQGDFQELLDNRLKNFLEKGVEVLTEEKYNNMIEEQFSRNQWVFKKN
ncbi:hypothetical protein H1230_19225 [Paenibacillus sp. 19GGS1-52]|uniref:hypothetical protein n=1 Tax=Paenibacillus sp. 19GGS1-52 TaxID=2758563 RepID=UPI001EFBC6E1|nr:hypothetical protein [Paenibacillus sp. 19GGS1-52]ULO05236.1 hypothetical protein H1230_19225 [Paenibacillus sp. 19GGS1-52]